MNIDLDFSTIYTFMFSLVSWLLWAVGRVLGFIGIDEGSFFYPIKQFLVDPQFVTFVSYLLVAVIYFVFVFLFAGLTVIWMERKLLGRFMDRRGTQVGVLGLFQNFADGIKTLLKEIIIPRDADQKVYTWAVVLIIATSAMLMGLVPWDDEFYAVNVPLALLLGLAVFSLAPFAILIGGWASNNKYTVIGGMRAAAQLIAYEVPMLLVVVSLVVMTGSLNFVEIVNWQNDNIILLVPLAIGALTFFVAGIAEVERVPFDLPEAEAELVEGWQTEYGGFRWGLIMLCDYIRAYIVCALFAILFLGGWLGPEPIPGAVWLLLKTFFLFFMMVWVRAAMVRIRTDQILKIGWRRLLPLAVINLVVVVLIKVYSVGGW
ncbi:MAG: NADH-quinone oxidoreductase subunit NuoH [Methanomassiliicoccales archaeon]|nr:MAG: NADH-quinone oxidoreductase subunit NuoH [Methanomassiliicoccales archaeon]